MLLSLQFCISSTLSYKDDLLERAGISSVMDRLKSSATFACAGFVSGLLFFCAKSRYRQ